MKLSTMQEALIKQVKKEYSLGYEYVRQDINRKKDVLSKVIFKETPKNTVRVNLLWKNIKLENALYLSDESLVTFISDSGVLGNEIMKNTNDVIRFDNEDMNLVEQRRKIIFENALYGVSITAIDGFDDEEQQPIRTSIHPLSVIPDPRNWTGNKMRFFGFTKRINIDSLKVNPAYTIPQDIDMPSKDQKYSDIERSEKQSVGSQYIDDEGMCDIYHHLTVYKGSKYLTSWINDREILVRCVEIEELSRKETMNPDEISFHIQIHRRNPLYGSFFGVSIADEILQYQDPISTLTNLLLVQARIATVGPDKYISRNLGVDLSMLSEKVIGGRVIPVNPQGSSIGANIYTDTPVNPSQFPTQMIQELESRAEGNTGATALAFGQSLSGSQTKAEVQTLMQNTNQLLTEVGNNYLRGEKAYWETHYKTYALYMGARKKKNIALYKNGSSVSKVLSKKDFIAKGKVTVFVESTSQIKKRNEKDFAKINSVAGMLLQNMKQGYAMNKFLRKILETLDVYELEPEAYIPESVDEMKARMNLELLNNNIEISHPIAGEDYMTYIEIYKQALDTPAKEKAIALYAQAYIDSMPYQTPESGVTDPTSSAMAMGIVNSTLSKQTPSLDQLTQ